MARGDYSREAIRLSISLEGGGGGERLSEGGD